MKGKKSIQELINSNPLPTIGIAVCFYGITAVPFLWNFDKLGFETILVPILYSIIWLLILFIILYILLSSKVLRTYIPKYNSKSRIAILLPISCKPYYENEDLKLMAEGFGEGISDFITKFDKQNSLSQSYEIVFIDSNKEYLAIKKIKEEIKYGTKYFISTISAFSTKISKEFLTYSSDAILITTISGSVEIKEVEGRIYNYYPTSDVEINAIVTCALSKNLKKPYIYNFNSVFTKECKMDFILKWNEKNSSNLHITDFENSFEFSNQSNFDKQHPRFNNEILKVSDFILILGYGNSFYDLISVLKTLDIDLESKTIYTLSTFKYRDWKLEEKEIIKGLNIITVRPKMKNEKFKTDKDVVKYFTEQTLDRVMRTIEKVNSEDFDFDNAWENSFQSRLDLINRREIQVETIKI